jgi:N-acetylglucosaminyl-diphospho-decaprenol L-rhamnosyltransferase
VPAIDVVVVSYNSRDELRACVTPLCNEDAVTVIVVDNASPDDSLESVADLPVVRVALDENRGFGYGCNVGWRRGAGEFVLFLNPDARMEASSVRDLAATLVVDSSVGIVGPKIVDEDGSVDFSIRRFPRLSSTYAQALFVHRLFPRARWADEVVRETSSYRDAGAAEWLSGACLLVRRDLLERLDGFDEGFFMYCEDKDLCRRAWALGYSVRFEPAAVATHVGGGGGSAPRGNLLPVLATSRVRYAFKHRRRTVAVAEKLGVALGSLTHAAVGRGDAVVRRGRMRAFFAALKAP